MIPVGTSVNPGELRSGPKWEKMFISCLGVPDTSPGTHLVYTNNNNNDNGQSQNQNSQRGRGGNQSRGRGHGYNPQQDQQQAYNQGYQPSQGKYICMAPPQMQPQNMMPPPPPFDPNWQLQQPQFTTPQQQQDNIPKASIHKGNIHRVKDNYHTQETVKITDNLSKLNMYVSCVETKAIMITNVNLQLILCK